MTFSYNGDVSPSKPLGIKLVELSGYGFAICVLIIGYEVVMRYGFNSPRIWVQDMVVMLVGSCFTLGGVVVLYEQTHIRITIFYDNVSLFAQRWLDLLASLVAVIYLGLVGYGAYVIATMSIKLNETTGTSWDSPLPMVLKVVLLLSVVTMTIVALTHIYTVLKRLGGWRSGC